MMDIHRSQYLTDICPSCYNFIRDRDRDKDTEPQTADGNEEDNKMTYNEIIVMITETEQEAINHMAISDQIESKQISYDGINHFDLAFRLSKKAAINHKQAAKIAPTAKLAAKHIRAANKHESCKWNFDKVIM